MPEINLDAMSIEDLREFHKRWHHTTHSKAEVLLGIRKHAKQNAQTLALYAYNKIQAYESRLTGDIQRAYRYEYTAQFHYNELPGDLQW